MRFLSLIAVASLAIAASAAGNFTVRGINPPNWRQCDGSWGSNRLGTCSGDTICSSGCAITSVAMFLAYRGWGGNPGTLNSWLTSNGGYASGCLIYWGAVDRLGFTSFANKQNPTYSTCCDSVDNKHRGLVANVNNGGHYVLVTSCAGNNVYNVNDPAGRRSTFSHGEVVSFAVYH